jgi:hypothetical protein
MQKIGSYITSLLRHNLFKIIMRLGYLLLCICDVVIALSYIWIAIELIRLFMSSEVVLKIKLNSDLRSLYQKISLVTICISASFVFLGLAHVSAN